MTENPSMSTNLAVHQTPLALSLCVGANLLFLLASPFAFFASTFQGSSDKGPFDDRVPYYGFLCFCSFGVASFSIVIFGAASTTFYKLVNHPIIPGQETSRYISLRNSFITVTILALVLSMADVCLSFLLGSAVGQFSGFAVPCFLAILATLADVAVALSVSIEFVREKQAFIQATGSEDALDEGLVRL